MPRTAPNFSNSTNRVPAHSLRHQTSASFAGFLLKRQHNSPLSSSSLLVVGKPWRVDYRVQLSSAAQGWKCMIITLWKCNQSSYVSCLPVYNSYYEELTWKRRKLSFFLTALSNRHYIDIFYIFNVHVLLNWNEWKFYWNNMQRFHVYNLIIYIVIMANLHDLNFT